MKNFLIGAFALLMTTMSYGADVCFTANGETQPYSPSGWSFVGLSENTTTTPIIAGVRDWKSVGFKANIEYSVKTFAHTMFVLNSDDFADLTFKYAVSIGNSSAATKAKITVNMQGGNSYVLYDGTLRTGSGSGTFNYSAVKPSTPISIPNSAPWYIQVQLYTTNTLTSSNFYVKIDDINFGCHPSLVGLSNNQSPVANAGADQNVSGTSATLNGSSSYDPGPSGDFIASYNWYQVDGPSTASIASHTSSITSVSGLVPGTYVFALVIADSHGSERTDYVNIVVSAPQPTYDTNRTFYNYSGANVMIGGASGTQYVASSGTLQLNVPANGAQHYTQVESDDPNITVFILVARTTNGNSMVWQREVYVNVGFDLPTVYSGYELYYELLPCNGCSSN